MFYLACAQLLTGLCFCWVMGRGWAGRGGVEEVVAESFIEKWCFFFRSNAARSNSATFWLSASRAGHALCCHPLGKQVQRTPCSYLVLETNPERKTAFLCGDSGAFGEIKAKLFSCIWCTCGWNWAEENIQLNFWVGICLSLGVKPCKLVLLDLLGPNWWICFETVIFNKILYSTQLSFCLETQRKGTVLMPPFLFSPLASVSSTWASWTS